jgi:phage tail-like protein
MALPNINIPGITQPLAAWHFAVSFRFFTQKPVKLSSKMGITGKVGTFVDEIAGRVKTLPSDLYDFRFTEVSGIGFTKEKKVVSTPGEDVSDSVPKSTTYSNLKLKRALVVNSPLAKWADQWRDNDTINADDPNAIEENKREKATVEVYLLSPLHIPVMAWTFERAWPVSYSISQLNGQKEDLVWEEIELTYATYKTIDIVSEVKDGIIDVINNIIRP